MSRQAIAAPGHRYFTPNNSDATEHGENYYDMLVKIEANFVELYTLVSGISAAELGFIDGVTAGTVTASKALVVDSSRDIATIRNLTMDGSLVTGAYTLTATEFSVLDGVTPGTITASKAAVVDSSKGLSGLGSITYADVANFTFSTSFGSRFGTTTTEKIGFWAAGPTTQPAVLAAITVTQPTATVFGFTTTAQFNLLLAAVNQLIANQKTIGFMATA